jgi:hypothetical protein
LASRERNENKKFNDPVPVWQDLRSRGAIQRIGDFASKKENNRPAAGWNGSFPYWPMLALNRHTPHCSIHKNRPSPLPENSDSEALWHEQR